jgi:hypothetical protein
MGTGRQKSDTPRGGNWRKLETIGDVRRFLRILILETKADKMDVKKANALGQLALILMKALEASTLETDLAAIKRRLDMADVRTTENGITTH